MSHPFSPIKTIFFFAIRFVTPLVAGASAHIEPLIRCYQHEQYTAPQALIICLREIRATSAQKQAIPIAALDNLQAGDIDFLKKLADIAKELGQVIPPRPLPFPQLTSAGKKLYQEAERQLSALIT